MIKLGITGGIGSGKSFVSGLLAQKGIPIYNCDQQAKHLTHYDQTIKQKLVELLGTNIYHQDGELNKKLLADYLFALPQNAQQINRIIHPIVKHDFLQWAKANAPFQLIAIESAILYESGFDSLVDRVLLIDAPEQLCIKRAMQRDNATLQQIKARMNQQYANAYKAKLADYVIHNNEDDLLEPQIEKVLRSLKNAALIR